MIEVIPEQPEVTKQLAESGLNVFRDYCITKRQQEGKCMHCEMLAFCMENFKTMPYRWET